MMSEVAKIVVSFRLGYYIADLYGPDGEWVDFASSDTARGAIVALLERGFTH